jgi:hypothetical protein
VRLPIIVIQNKIELPQGALLMTGFTDVVTGKAIVSAKETSGIVAIYIGSTTTLGEEPKDYNARETIRNLHLHHVCRQWGTTTPAGTFVGVANLLAVENATPANADKIHASQRPYISMYPTDRLYYFKERVPLQTPLPKRYADNKRANELSTYADTQFYPELELACQTLQKAITGDMINARY